MEQLVEKEVQKKKEEEEERKVLQERDAEVRRQIEIEKERLKEKDIKMKVLMETMSYLISFARGQVKSLQQFSSEIAEIAEWKIA